MALQKQSHIGEKTDDDNDSDQDDQGDDDDDDDDMNKQKPISMLFLVRMIRT